MSERWNSTWNVTEEEDSQEEEEPEEEGSEEEGSEEEGSEEEGSEEEGSEEEGSEEEGSEEEGSEEENHTFEPTIETEDELLPEDPTDLDAMNTYSARINTPDSDGNESDNDLSDPSPSIPLSHPLENNL